jgi:hypothetical protein
MPGEKVRATVTVSDTGQVTANVPHMSYRQGFADLLDFSSPPREVAILPPGAPTAIGMVRTGTALRSAIAAFGKTKP